MSLFTESDQLENDSIIDFSSKKEKPLFPRLSLPFPRREEGGWVGETADGQEEDRRQEEKLKETVKREGFTILPR